MQRTDSAVPAPRRAGRSPITITAAVLLLAAAGAALWRPGEVAPTPTGAPPMPAGAIAPAAAATSVAGTPDRVAAPPVAAPPSPAAADEPLVFEAAIERLCELATATAVLAQQDEIEAARDSDGAARALFARVLEQFEDTGERSLALLTTLLAPFAGAAGDDASTIDEAHRIVLQMLLAADLQRRYEVALAAATYDRVDALTQAALDAAPVHTTLAEVVDADLDGHQYLRLPHEPAVLQLVQLAGEERFPRAVATHLLRTLWDNLQHSGQRSSDELLRLAVVLLETTDPSQALVACRHLLADPRFRPLVLTRLRERGDRELAGQLAQMAAAELEPQVALGVLRELHPLLDNARGDCLGLGLRAPEAVADAYRLHLASDTMPALRCDLVMGLGMLPEGPGLELAATALADDPSPDVRLQAAFVFTVRGTPAQAERALAQLLDDPEVAAEPARLTAIVLALQNLEAVDVNVVARLAGRLAAMPLPSSGRRMLEELVARSLPGGAMSALGR
ncbi:MAG: hypothetical protein H6835_09170 [Planctomycetes bacterium]|nr:hypothetical protein [Planctomycetota bacterium]